jgi:plastocyanin
MKRVSRFGSIRLLAALMLVALAAVVSLGSGGTVQAQEDASVDIVDFAFDASSITVEVGSTVTWTNAGDATHTVTSDDGSFDSGDLASGETFSFTFDEPGTYTYFCAIHPDMVGEIVVTEAAGDDTGDDTADDDTADDDTALPSTGAGTTATQGLPYALLALAIVLAASGFLTSRRRPMR